MKILIVILALVGFTLSACDQSLEPAQPQSSSSVLLQKTSVIKFGGGTIVYNPCCDEWVLATGEGILVWEDGAAFPKHITVRNLSGAGWNQFPYSPGASPTGHTYSAQGAATVNYSMRDNGGMTATWKQRMVNQDGCGFFLKQTIHITINANGDITAEVTKSEVTCE